MKRTKQGFTIVELIVVILVIGILTSISVVAYNQITSRARDSKRKADVDSIIKNLQIYATRNSALPIGNSDTSQLKTSGARCPSWINSANVDSFMPCNVFMSAPASWPRLSKEAAFSTTNFKQEDWSSFFKQVPEISQVTFPSAGSRQYLNPINQNGTSDRPIQSWLGSGEYSVAAAAFYATSPDHVEVCYRISYLPERHKYGDLAGTPPVKWMQFHERYVCTPGFPAEHKPRDVIY